MKRILPFVMIFALSGCLSEYDHAIADLEDKLNQMEAVSIASLSEQVSMLKESVVDLGEVDEGLNGYIENLEGVSEDLSDKIAKIESSLEALKGTSASDLGELEQNLLEELESAKSALEEELEAVNDAIAALSQKHLDMQQSISDLEDYVDNELAASEEWVESTYATLVQYNELQKSLSDVKAIVDNLLAKTDSMKTELEAAFQADLASAISASEEGMRQWVSEKLQNDYYTIAQTQALLDALKSELSSEDDALLEKISAVEKALTEADAALTEAYKAAIKEAIETNNGVIEQKISEAVSAASNILQGKIDILGTTIDEISTQLGLLDGRVDALETRIQSIRYLPEYSDGEVFIGKYTKSVTLDFMVAPSAAAAQLQSSWEAGQDVVGGYVHYVETRASASPVAMKVKSVAGSADGLLTVVLAEDDSNPLSDGFWSGTQAAFVYVTVGDGNNDVISELVPLTYSGYEIVEEEGQGEEEDKLTYYVDALPGLLKWAYDVNVLGNKNADFVLINDVEIPQFEIVRDDDARTYAYSDVPITVDSGTGVPSGSNWVPIRNVINDYPDTYTGHIDGGNYTISGLRLNSSASYTGFIGYMFDDTSLKNLIFEDAVIYSSKGNTGIVGKAQDGAIIENVHVRESAVSGGGDNVGGLAGYIQRRKGGNNNYDEDFAYIRNCTIDDQSSVSGRSYVGGICGNVYGSVIIGCRSDASVKASGGRVGGLAGYIRDYWGDKNNSARAYNGYIIGCISTGPVTASTTASNGYSGGFVGHSLADVKNHVYTNVFVVSCFSSSEVEGKYKRLMIGNVEKQTTLVASIAKKQDDIANTNSTTDLDVFVSDSYTDYSGVTPEIVAAMNVAIEEYNQRTDIEGQTCPYRWVLTSGEWPTLSVVNP